MKSLRISPDAVRGFNYHPSYSGGSFEDWLLFDASVWERELENGKRLYPNINTIRIWLSWNAYCRGEQKFIAAVQSAIEICRKLELVVIPVIFNRWHDPMVDCDGVYLDHFLPGSSWLLKFGDPFEDYIDALAKAFGKEEQILVWDICNEPFAYGKNFPLKEEIYPHELAWIQRMTAKLRAGVSQPIGIGSTGKHSMRDFGNIFDVYLTHLYYRGEPVEEFEARVKRFVDEAHEDGCPLIVSECCWGSTDDRHRAELMQITLKTFKKYKIGFVAHALQYCGCADLHNSCDGRLTDTIGNLAFTTKEGTMRPYHEIFNEF